MVAVAIEATVGRVAAASLGISGGSRVRSALGWTGPSPLAILPTMQGSGQTELLVLSTADGSIRFGVTALTEDQPRPGGRSHGAGARAGRGARCGPGRAGPTALARSRWTTRSSWRRCGRSTRAGTWARRAAPCRRRSLDPVPGVGRLVPLAGRRPRERRRRRAHRDDRGRPVGGGTQRPRRRRSPSRRTARPPCRPSCGRRRRTPRSSCAPRSAAGRPHGLHVAAAEDAFALSLGVPLPHEP